MVGRTKNIGRLKSLSTIELVGAVISCAAGIRSCGPVNMEYKRGNATLFIRLTWKHGKAVCISTRIKRSVDVSEQYSRACSWP